MCDAVLRVELLHPVGRPKIVRIPRDVAESLGLRSGDVVEVRVGGRATVARLEVSSELRGAVQMGYSTGLSLGVGMGEEVGLSFRRVEPVPAKRIVLEPDEPGKVYELIPTPMMLALGTFPALCIAVTRRETSSREYVRERLRYVKQVLLGTPFVEGDYVVLKPNQFTWAEGGIVLRVAETEPSTAVYIDRNTLLEVT